MPSNGSATVDDLSSAGLGRLRVACPCGRAGSYGLPSAAARWGWDGRLTDILAQLTADCPRGKGAAVHDRCAAVFPDLAVRRRE
jgi:hypothetical protein